MRDIANLGVSMLVLSMLRNLAASSALFLQRKEKKVYKAIIEIPGPWPDGWKVIERHTTAVSPEEAKSNLQYRYPGCYIRLLKEIPRKSTPQLRLLQTTPLKRAALEVDLLRVLGDYLIEASRALSAGNEDLAHTYLIRGSSLRLYMEAQLKYTVVPIYDEAEDAIKEGHWLKLKDLGLKLTKLHQDAAHDREDVLRELQKEE